MSAIANLSSAAALPPVIPHLHGHKKGSHYTSGGSDEAAQVPAGLRQNLFASLLDSVEQVIGVRATTPTPAATDTTSAPAASLVGSKLDVTA